MACTACGSILNGIYKHAPMTREQVDDSRNRDREIVVITDPDLFGSATKAPSSIKNLLAALHIDAVPEPMRFTPAFEMTSDANDSDRRHLVTWEMMYAMRNSFGGLRYLKDGGINVAGDEVNLAETVGSLRSFNGSEDGVEGDVNCGCITTVGEEGKFSVSLGQNSIVTGDFSTIAGGGGDGVENGNLITGIASFIGAGIKNTINTTDGHGIFIGAGEENKVTAHVSAIVGGKGNTITCAFDAYAIIGAGSGNTIDSSNPYGACILGGIGNGIHGSYGSGCGILSGNDNSINGGYSIISGGSGNKIEHHDRSVMYSFIGGGDGNEVAGSYSSIVGGENNAIVDKAGGEAATDAVIVGGSNNRIHKKSNNAGILCGNGNIIGGSTTYVASSRGSVIIGGWGNKLDASNNSIIMVGESNVLVNSGQCAIVSGYLNEIHAASNSIICGGGGIGSANRIKSIDDEIVGGSFMGTPGKSYIHSSKSFIGTGSLIYIHLDGSFVGSGESNRIEGNQSIHVGYSAILTGKKNIIESASYSGIVTGTDNSISYRYDAMGSTFDGASTDTNRVNIFIGGGQYNHAFAKDSGIVAGQGNYILSTCGDGTLVGRSFIGAGYSNKLDKAPGSAIVTGNMNQMSTYDTETGPCSYSLIGSGESNKIQSASSSAVLSGSNNDIFSGFGNSIVGGSYNNITHASNSSILGGSANKILAGQSETGLSFIGGGSGNTIYGYSELSSIVGGGGNYIHSLYVIIGGGRDNAIVSSSDSTISGGNSNYIGTSDGENANGDDAIGSFIGGGHGNKIYDIGTNGGNRYADVVIAGGHANEITGMCAESSILGGHYNRIMNECAYSSIIGGSLNYIQGGSSHSTITGYNNYIGGTSSYAFVSGSSNHIVTSSYGFIGGGSRNYITGSPYSAMIGGVDNRVIDVDYVTIVGSAGSYVTDSADYATIVGGAVNTVYQSSIYSAIIGGTGNVIGDGSPYAAILGGNTNTIEDSGEYSVISGGANNIVGSKYSAIGSGNTNKVNNPTPVGDIYAGSFIGSGYNNVITNGTDGNIIGAGRNNNISQQSSGSGILSGDGNHIHGGSTNSFIGAGISNELNWSSKQSAIVGGASNIIGGSSVASIIGAGSGNSLSSPGSGIFSGASNIIRGGEGNAKNIIGAGYGNQINTAVATTGTRKDWNGNETDGCSVIGGGTSNTIDHSSSSTISGGAGNLIDYAMSCCSIGGGYQNKIISISTSDTSFYLAVGSHNGEYQGMAVGTICGGSNNAITVSSGSDDHDVIMGGVNNRINTAARSTICGGVNNQIDSCEGSTILGGRYNRVYADYSIAGGMHHTINSAHNYTVAFGVSNTINHDYAYMIGTGLTSQVSYALHCNDLYAKGGVSGASAYSERSDRRAKTDISNLVYGLDFINSLTPVSYKMVTGKHTVESSIGDDGNPVVALVDVAGMRTHFGLIAQDVKAVVDEIGVDFAGHIIENVDSDPDGLQALRYSEFIAPIIKSIQELTQKLNNLSGRLDILENK